MSITLPPPGATPPVAQGSAGNSFEEKLNAAKASSAIVGYMNEKGMSAIHLNDLKNLANGSGGVSQEVSSAAAYMVRHEEVFTAIETNDVARVDQYSGVWNFEWAAAGGLDGTSIEAIAQMSDAFDRAIDKSAQITEITTGKKTELDSSKQRPNN